MAGEDYGDGLVVHESWRRRCRDDVGGVMVVLGYGIFDFDMVGCRCLCGFWGGRWLLKGEVALEELGELVLGVYHGGQR